MRLPWSSAPPLPLLLFLLLLFLLSFPQGICWSSRQQSVVSPTAAFVFVLAFAFLVVIPEGNLLFRPTCATIPLTPDD